MKKVYLIGAGPGDPELITVKARRILAGADSILYDHLANDALLRLAPAHAERLYVGKKKSDHAYSQEEISAMLVDRARRGLTVVRLKGGDPFIFGRGGEELEALAAAGIEARSTSCSNHDQNALDVYVEITMLAIQHRFDFIKCDTLLSFF